MAAPGLYRPEPPLPDAGPRADRPFGRKVDIISGKRPLRAENHEIPAASFGNDDVGPAQNPAVDGLAAHLGLRNGHVWLSAAARTDPAEEESEGQEGHGDPPRAQTFAAGPTSPGVTRSYG